jgi:hypothetical protein
MTLEKELQEIKKREKEIISEMEDKKSRLKFQCVCGKMHAIRDCEGIQTHWYTRPSGCCEGDYWNSGEVHIICPNTLVRNRILFMSYYDVPWRKRDNIDYNAEWQFKRTIVPLLKKVTDEHLHDEQKNYRSFNNEYFDHNHKKFGIEIKPYDSNEL